MQLLEVVKSLAETFDLETLKMVVEQACVRLLDCRRAQVRLGGEGASEGEPDLVVLPLRDADDAYGVLEIWRGAALDLAKAELLASLASIAIKRQMLLNEARAKSRLERDMARAGELIQSLLPGSMGLPGYELAGLLRPAHLTGGDLYDVVEFGDGLRAFLVADATGHGVDSTILVSQCRAYFRALLSEWSDPLQVVTGVNRLLCRDLHDRFVTACLVVLDLQSHELFYVSAGHGPLLRCGLELEWLPATGPPLGIDLDSGWELAGPHRVEVNDLWLLGTDGLVEWRNQAGEQFGEARLREALAELGSQPCERLLAELFSRVESFAQNPQSDDATALAWRRLPMETGEGEVGVAKSSLCGS
ncbi:MAG: serine/threonine-protein phosphatase [Candidatus Eremiobacteraeota bacterium]|nr:serine/threonine-protein phosphatase [Candidatus Eremiobacteraeota bacterium]